MKEVRPIKYCTRNRRCNARIKLPSYSLCCGYGWCGWAQPSQDRGDNPKAQWDNFVPLGRL